MKSRLLGLFFVVGVGLTPATAVAQQSAAPAAMAASNAVPNLVNYTGVLKDASGRTLTRVTGVTFLLYSAEQGGAPLWLETQNVTPDKAGHYTVQLGAASKNGISSDLFVSGEGRWLAVQIGNEPEQPRVLLVAVPYAMKAADAQTLAGLPPSAFVMAQPHSANSRFAPQNATNSNTINPAITGTGATANFLPLWTTTSNLGSSVAFQNPTTKNIGLGTTAPQGKLSVASSNPGSGFNTLFAWNSAYSTFGPNVGSTTGAALALGYSTSDNAANIVSLAPGVAWKPLRLASGGLIIDAANGSEAMRVTSGGNVDIGTKAPIVETNTSGTRLSVQGANAAGQVKNAQSGVVGQGGIGGNADNSDTFGGIGVVGIGGQGGNVQGALIGFPHPGPGGAFSGGGSPCCGGDNAGGDGIDAFSGVGPFNEITGWAGNFTGDINVTGAIFAGNKDFKIDHPLDPANKYLLHSSVESNEMMNIYTGNVTTSAEGEAMVQLPQWFQTENGDFRYQLTVIGQFAQAIVANEIANNRFTIRTDKPNVKVSWQVTAVRQDAYAKAHPLVVEQEKDARLRGFYIHPELYGAPEEKQIEWARHPETMRYFKEIRSRH
jgi:hypothetical protein